MSTLIKCPNGHYYDAEQYASCPFCEGAGAAAADEPTAPMPGIFDDDLSSTIPDLSETAPAISSIDDEFDKTIGMAVWEGKNTGGTGTVTPVVGWLVCKRGSEFGRSFELKAGRNFIGRSDENDISIKGDQAISRKEHAIVVYDPKAAKYHVQPGSSSELFYVNDEVVLQVREINDRDIITLGETDLVFVPLCDSRFSWEG